MSRTRNKIIGSLASALVVAGAVAPGASAADDLSSPGASARSATELGQAVGEPGDAVQTSARSATELGQAVGEPGDAVQTSARSATELGQAVGEPGDGDSVRAVQADKYQDLRSPTAESSGFNWGDAAIVAGGGLGLLIGIGGMVLVTRRRGAVRKSRAPVVSS